MTSSCILSKPPVTVYVTELIIQVQVGLTKESSGVEGPWILQSLQGLVQSWHKLGQGVGGVGFSKGHLSNGSL